jgi:hypothetical protein
MKIRSLRNPKYLPANRNLLGEKVVLSSARRTPAGGGDFRMGLLFPGRTSVFLCPSYILSKALSYPRLEDVINMK